jgi:putative chitinase
LGNGNVASGDAWKYCGRGFIQLTGKYNYQVLTTEHNKIWGENLDFVVSPEKVSDSKYAVRSALVFWKVHNLSILAEKGVSEADSNSITKVVNLYTDSYAQRFTNLQFIMSLEFFKECV